VFADALWEETSCRQHRQAAGAAAQSLILKQQRVEEKRLFLTRRGRRTAVHVETSPRDSLLRRK